MARPISISLFLLIVVSLSSSSSSSSSSSEVAVFDITSFGAKADGKTDSARPFTDAFGAACSSSDAATINVPAGTFLVGPVTFVGPCKSGSITVQIDGTIVAPSNYNELATKGGWMLFDHVDGVSVYGGVMDGRGASLWSCKAGGHSCPDGATVSAS